MLRQHIDQASIVVAHPDDEILWFSSVVQRAKAVHVCFMELPENATVSAGREALARCFPLANTEFLGITESVAFQGADWRDPVETSYGLEVRRRKGILPGFDAARYRANFQTLVDTLTDRLQGVETVLTHNPWGEYGHEDHVQVYRAVSKVKETLGFELWYSNYCSERAFPLMLRHIRGLRGDSEQFETNLELARSIETLYREHQCWTWPFDDYPYFDTEQFIIDAPRASRRHVGSIIPLNFIEVDGPTQNGGSATAIMRRAARRARKALTAVWAG